MANSSDYLAGRALSLPPQQREQLARLLMQKSQGDGCSGQEILAELRTRPGDPKSGKNAGMSFEAVFGEPL